MDESAQALDFKLQVKQTHQNMHATTSNIHITAHCQNCLGPTQASDLQNGHMHFPGKQINLDCQHEWRRQNQMRIRFSPHSMTQTHPHNFLMGLKDANH